jgi:hypothetical protein
MVYNHSGALHHPWYWALIHGGFILAESAALLIYWRVNETVQVDLSREKERAEPLNLLRGCWLRKSTFWYLKRIVSRCRCSKNISPNCGYLGYDMMRWVGTHHGVCRPSWMDTWKNR